MTTKTKMMTVKPRTGLMVHKWSWCTAEWDTLPDTLTKLEIEGWEIFAVVEIGELGRFVKVVYRRRIT